LSDRNVASSEQPETRVAITSRRQAEANFILEMPLKWNWEVYEGAFTICSTLLSISPAWHFGVDPKGVG
jgi:hypothetical protein